ncbi:MAG: TetR/AcrR family transcriptional regulator [Actinomycetota bacterium]
MAVVEPTRQRERREASTAALLDAAGQLVLEGGFTAMTFAAIGERAGYSRAMVTARFGSRRGLIEALLDRLITRWYEETYPTGHSNTGLQSILALIDLARRRSEDAPDELRVFYALLFEAIGGEPLLRNRMLAFHDDFRDRLVEVAARGQRDGSIVATLDPADEVNAVIGGMRGVAYQWLLEPGFDAARAFAYLRSVVNDRLAAEPADAADPTDPR